MAVELSHEDAKGAVMKSELLHVVAAYSNPARWKNRLKVHTAFEQHMLDSGVQLTTVECAYGNTPFVLPDNPKINRVQVRAKTILWHKENLLNIGISRLPTDWQYVCWCDADLTFRKPTWASDTVHALQTYDIVQPWSDAYDLGPNDEHIQSHRSFCRQFVEGEPVVPAGQKMWTFNGGPYIYPHSGFCWAATRQTIEWVGGLIDTSAVGAADHHMALSLVGAATRSLPGGVAPGYVKPIALWESRALTHINHNIGFVWGTVEHSWHGRKTDRKYIDRWQIVTGNQFDPSTDLKRNSFGVYELTGNKPKLTAQLIQYFNQRCEDANTIT